MKILRKIETRTDNLVIGDQIIVKLKNAFHDKKYTATVQKVTDTGALFMFDDCVAELAMNARHTNEGGFQESALRYWLENTLLPNFQKKLRKRVKYISLPTYGQIFGHDEFYNNFEPDDDDQLELMKYEKNRIACWNGKTHGYWLTNPTKKNVSAANFARARWDGSATSAGAGNSNGVRPVFFVELQSPPLVGGHDVNSAHGCDTAV